jgi:subtilisin family serine protease
MKVTVKEYLNVRVGEPRLKAPTYQYLAPGSEIEIDGQLYKGDLFDGIDTWVKDLAGNYYWSGGTNYVKDKLPVQFINSKMSWGHKWYDLPFVWNDLKTTGQGVTVAIIDTGVDDNHPDLKTKLHGASKSFVDNAIDIKDTDGHGTNMAGIIGASGNNVFGVAPGVTLLVVKATKQVRGANPKVFAEALNYAAAIPDVDIISFSNVFSDGTDLNGPVQNCIKAKKILVAAIGNGRNFIGLQQGPDSDTFPACFPNVLAVGSFGSNGEICTFSNWNPQLSLLAPGDFSVLTTGLNNKTEMGAGTSIATAFTSGCLALMIAYGKGKSITGEQCIASLLGSCDDIGSSIGRDIQSGFGRMNLRNAINKIKNL